MFFYLSSRENWDKVFFDPLILIDTFYPTGNPNAKPGRLVINIIQGSYLHYLPSEFPDYSKNKFI